MGACVCINSTTEYETCEGCVNDVHKLKLKKIKSSLNKLMTEPGIAVQSCPVEVSEQILEYSNLVMRGVTTRCYINGKYPFKPSFPISLPQRNIFYNFELVHSI